MHTAYCYLTRGSLSSGSLSRGPRPGGAGLCTREGSLSRGLCPGVSVWMGFLSRVVSVRWARFLSGESLSEGGICSKGVSVRRGSLPGRPPPPVDRQMPVKILPCPKLRLQAVNILTLRVSLRLILQYIHEQSYRSNVTGHFEFLFSSGPST